MRPARALRAMPQAEEWYKHELLIARFHFLSLLNFHYITLPTYPLSPVFMDHDWGRFMGRKALLSRIRKIHSCCPTYVNVRIGCMKTQDRYEVLQCFKVG